MNLIGLAREYFHGWQKELIAILKALRIYWAPFKTFDLEIDYCNPSLSFCIKVYSLFEFCKKFYYFSNEINFWSLFLLFFLDGMQECQMFKWMTWTDFFSQARCMYNRYKCSLSNLRYVRFFFFFCVLGIYKPFIPSIYRLVVTCHPNKSKFKKISLIHIFTLYPSKRSFFFMCFFVHLTLQWIKYQAKLFINEMLKRNSKFWFIFVGTFGNKVGFLSS